MGDSASVAGMRVRLMIRTLRLRLPPGRKHSFVEIDHEISSTVILTDSRMCTILVNRLEDLACPVSVLRHNHIGLTGPLTLNTYKAHVRL